MNIVQANKSLKNLTQSLKNLKLVLMDNMKKAVEAIIHPKMNIRPSLTHVSPNLCKIISATEYACKQGLYLPIKKSHNCDIYIYIYIYMLLEKRQRL